MPPLLTRADSLREYLTGATADGAAQSNPLASLGNYRSASEAPSFGLLIRNAITGVTITYASGGNPPGVGLLTATDTTHLTWQAPDASGPGNPVDFSDGNPKIVESLGQPGMYLRVTPTLPFSIGQSQVTLTYLVDNYFGFDDVSISLALAGMNQYRASMVRNESTATIGSLKRWIGTLGAQQVSNIAWLAGSGGGPIATTGSFSSWPAVGWVQVQSSGGALKEIVYYTSRTTTMLTVGATGRGLLGTVATAGSGTDLLFPVPGIALAVDPNGVQNFGGFIQSIANATTSPATVAWNLGITAGTGLQIGNLLPNQQVGIWVWRQIPPAAAATPLALNQTLQEFGAS